MKARIAQLVEQLAFNQLVLGSSPSPRTSTNFQTLTKPASAEMGSLGTKVGTKRPDLRSPRNTGSHAVITAFTVGQIGPALSVAADEARTLVENVLGAFAGGAAPGDLGDGGVSHDRHLAGSPAAVAGAPTAGGGRKDYDALLDRWEVAV